ncbi:hypothetical protein, partial [Enterobacter sp. SECR19-1250]
RFNTPLSCLQPPQQGKTHLYTVYQSIKNATADLPSLICHKNMIQKTTRNLLYILIFYVNKDINS